MKKSVSFLPLPRYPQWYVNGLYLLSYYGFLLFLGLVAVTAYYVVQEDIWGTIRCALIMVAYSEFMKYCRLVVEGLHPGAEEEI